MKLLRLTAWLTVVGIAGALVVAGCRPTGDSGKQPSAGTADATRGSSSTRDTARDTIGQQAGHGGAATSDRPTSQAPIAGESQSHNATGVHEPDRHSKSAGSPSQNASAPGEAPQTQESADMLPSHPFPHRIAMPEFPANADWLNSKPLKLQDLRGKFVLLDFWTYCCINCMHILPELKKLEQLYAKELVVIGVHSAKFDAEQVTDNIAAAILRYDIEHPVFNDRGQEYWNTLGVRSWPTVVLIDPEGHAIWARAGEIVVEDVQPILELAIPYYRSKGKLDERPVRFPLLAYTSQRTALRFPGKILADESTNRMFIADSNHHRIVIATLDGELLEVIGSGRLGRDDGDYSTCSFHKPQGMALHGQTLYVADTENHLIRKVDLVGRRVTTIAGTGVQGRIPWPGMESLSVLDEAPSRWVGAPLKTALNSPWDLWIHENNLYIAMAGPHQIWKMPLDESEIGPYAGNAREDIVDGPLLPSRPYELGSASFAQPSGLSSDGTWLYVADSEGSSIRAVPFDPNGSVRTVVGTSHLPYARLFTFGDRDGKREEVLLQHCLAVLYHQGKLYVADTYNNKIKVVDAQTGDAYTLAGTGEAGETDEPARFYEPGGLALARNTLYIADTNNHRIRTIDLATGNVRTLVIQGLQPPAQQAPKPDFSDAVRYEWPAISWKTSEGQAPLRVRLDLPISWKLNEEAPIEVWIEAHGSQTGFRPDGLGRKEILPPANEFQVTLPVVGDGNGQLVVQLLYYYCEGDRGLCKAESVVWQVPFTLSDQTGENELLLTHSAR